MEQAKIRVCAATHTLESVWEKYVGTYFGLKIVTFNRYQRWPLSLKRTRYY